DIVLQSPTSFLRNPLGWLRNMAAYRGTMAAAPNFALAYCVRRFRAAALEGVDLSPWRVLFVGAERVNHSTVKAFAETFAPSGFSPDAIYPCYGTAETTLAVTMPSGKRTPRSSWG